MTNGTVAAKWPVGPAEAGRGVGPALVRKGRRW